MLFLIPVTFKQGQSHQTCYKLMDHKQAYDHTKFERSCFNSVQENVNLHVFLQMGKYVVYLP